MQPPLCSGSLLVHYTGLRIARVRIARYPGGIQGLLGLLLVHPRSHIGCRLFRRSGVHWACISIRPACRCHHMNARRRRPGTHRSRSPSVRSIGRYCCRAEYFVRRHIVDCLVGKHPSRRHSQRYHPPPQMHQRRKRDRPNTSAQQQNKNQNRITHAKILLDQSSLCLIFRDTLLCPDIASCQSITNRSK